MRIINRIANLAKNRNKQTRLSHQARQRYLNQFDSVRANAVAEEIARLLRPSTHPELEWLGSRRDGGYALARQTISPPRDWAVSIGVGEEISADVALANRGLRVHLFDPYVESPLLPNRNLFFYKKGLGSETPDLCDLSDLIRQCAEDGPPSFLLIDIEGAEWSSLIGEGDALGLFDQVAIELHGLGDLADPDKSEDIVEVIRVLTQAHSPVFWRANNHGPLLSIGGFHVPDVLEVSLVRTSLLTALPARGAAFAPRLQNSRSLPPIPYREIFSRSASA